MSKQGKLGPIVWCVDPFAGETKLHKHALRILLPFVEKTAKPLKPVTFVDMFRALEKGSGYYFPLRPIESEPFESLKSLAERRLAPIRKLLPKKMLGEVKYITHKEDVLPTLSDKVAAIDGFAKSQNALFLAVHTHSRTGVNRLLLGSLAETLLLTSKNRLLFMNTRCQTPKTLSHVVFASDLSSQSIKAFERLIPLLSALGTRVSLLHCLRRTSKAQKAVQQLFPALGKRQGLERDRAEKKGQQLCRSLQDKGIDATFAVEYSEASDLSVSIVGYAKNQRADIIAIAGQSGGMKAAILGSTSRNLVRRASCPVLVAR